MRLIRPMNSNKNKLNSKIGYLRKQKQKNGML